MSCCIYSVCLISSSASCSGVAAAVEEVAKDDHEKHLVTVEKVGADFVLLVVEWLGVWTHFTLKILKC